LRDFPTQGEGHSCFCSERCKNARYKTKAEGNTGNGFRRNQSGHTSDVQGKKQKENDKDNAATSRLEVVIDVRGKKQDKKTQKAQRGIHQKQETTQQWQAKVVITPIHGTNTKETNQRVAPVVAHRKQREWAF
jgi:hypothetical protein